VSNVQLEQLLPNDIIDMLELIAEQHGWGYERNTSEELLLVVEGKWAKYSLSLTWLHELETLHLACSYNLAVRADHRIELMTLLCMINEQLWIGHFDLWSEEGSVMYRHALPLPDETDASAAQLETLIATAIECSERYFQAFQFVIASGKSATAALESSMFETYGEA
jgi:hypothetical protein